MPRTSVHDVASYILRQQGRMSTMRLEKLCYYCQAWHLAWDGEPFLFSEDFQAWASGPVCHDLFEVHEGEFSVDSWKAGDADALSDSQRDTVDAVLDGYRDWSGVELGLQARSESPWIEARGDCKLGDRCTEDISKAIMQERFHRLSLASEDN